jgi:hypothetical protein
VALVRASEELSSRSRRSVYRQKNIARHRVQTNMARLITTVFWGLHSDAVYQLLCFWRLKRDKRIFLFPVDTLQRAVCMKMRTYIREVLYLKVLMQEAGKLSVLLNFIYIDISASSDCCRPPVSF